MESDLGPGSSRWTGLTWGESLAALAAVKNPMSADLRLRGSASGCREGSLGLATLVLANQHEDSWIMGRARRSCPVQEGSAKELSHHALLGPRVDVTALAEAAPVLHPAMVGKGEGSGYEEFCISL